MAPDVRKTVQGSRTISHYIHDGLVKLRRWKKTKAGFYSHGQDWCMRWKINLSPARPETDLFPIILQRNAFPLRSPLATLDLIISLNLLLSSNARVIICIKDSHFHMNGY
jgi:hypothetical protein